MKPTHFQIEFTNERIIPSGGLTLVGYLLDNSGFIDRLNMQDITGRRSGHQIKMVISLAPISDACAWESLILRQSVRRMTTRNFSARQWGLNGFHHRKFFAREWMRLAALCAVHFYGKTRTCL